MPGAAGQAVLLPAAPSPSSPASALALVPLSVPGHPGQGLPSAAIRWRGNSPHPVALAICMSYCILPGAEVHTWKLLMPLLETCIALMPLTHEISSRHTAGPRGAVR